MDSGAEPAEQISVLDSAITRLQARQAEAVRRFEAQGGLDGSGCKTIGSWTKLHLRHSVSAHRMVQHAKWLPELAGFAAAHSAGPTTTFHEYGFTVRRETVDGGVRLVHRRPDGTLLPAPDDSLRAVIDQLRLDYADDDDRRAGETRDPPHAA